MNGALVPIATEIVRHEHEDFMPVFSIAHAKQRRDAVVEFVQAIMVPGTDFGVIPGTTKPCLLKPGAERLCSFFGFNPEFITLEEVQDWKGEHHGGEPFFYVKYKCKLVRNGRTIGDGEGSCNSWETRYRYRAAERKCPACGKPAIIKGREEYGGGWICFGKKGGCGAKFGDKDPQIVDQQTGKVVNPDVADLVNTIQKMAQKRALIAATLIGVNASEFFTQDLEDRPVEEPGSQAAADKVAEEKLAGRVPLTNKDTPRQLSPEDEERIERHKALLKAITEALVSVYPELTGKHKDARQVILMQAFGLEKFSWKVIECLPNDQLEAGLQKVHELLTPDEPEAKVIWIDKFDCLDDFKRIKKSLVTMNGPAGEAEYYRVLKQHGVEKSNEFGDDLVRAMRCFNSLREVEKLMCELKQPKGGV